jgi:hypothetical protein
VVIQRAQENNKNNNKKKNNLYFPILFYFQMSREKEENSKSESSDHDYLSYVFSDASLRNDIRLHVNKEKREKLRTQFLILESKIDKLFNSKKTLGNIQDDIDFTLLTIDLSSAKSFEDYERLAEDIKRGMYTLLSSPSSPFYDSTTSSDDDAGIVLEYIE